jgi:hypothetical protein
MNKRLDESKLWNPSNQDDDDDDGGEGGESGGGFYDPGRQTVAVGEIRKFESQFGVVDGSTHRDLNNEDVAALMEEFGGSLDAAERHPLLAGQVYFSGVSDTQERPINEGNLEAEEQYAKQLSKSPKYQEILRKIAEKKNEKRLKNDQSMRFSR